MIFGNKERFAIECIIDTENSNQKYTFGSIAIWIGKEQLGQLSLIVVLEIPVSYFKVSLNDCGKRRNEEFQQMNSLQIFDFLRLILWGQPKEKSKADEKSYSELIQEFNTYEKFNICINFSESFDGENLYLIETDDTERFIWRIFGSEEINEIDLPLGTYKEVVQSFLDWFYDNCPKTV